MRVAEMRIYLTNGFIELSLLDPGEDSRARIIMSGENINNLLTTIQGVDMIRGVSSSNEVALYHRDDIELDKLIDGKSTTISGNGMSFIKYTLEIL